MNQRYRLLVDSNDGSPASEYRMEGEIVEVRALAPEEGMVGLGDSLWRPLTSDQLSSHVERNTVVAQWLEKRMGWRRLLLACVGEGWWSESGGCHSNTTDARTASA